MTTMPQVPQVKEEVPPVSIPAGLEQQIRDELRVEFEQLLTIWKQDELAKVESKLDTQVKALFDEYTNKLEEDKKPLTTEQIQTLLSQEYVSLNVPIKCADETGLVKDLNFVIRELPQSIERKFYKQFRGKLSELAPQMQGFVQANVGKDTFQLLQSFLDTFDNGLDIMSETVVLVLDPFSQSEVVTKKWVIENISCIRQMNIVRAQAEVNKLRDFFSQLFQAGQTMGTMTAPLSYQRLLEQSRS